MNIHPRMLPIALAAGLLVLALPRPGHAQDVVIKLGTAAPVGSPWHLLLKETAQEWDKITSGKVKLKIFAGGTMGNEGDMVKKMRIGQLQAAALSSIGLHEITPEPMVLDMPLFIESREQHKSMLDQVGPRLEKALQQKGYIVLNWGEVGFVRFFSTKPRATLAQMRDSKLFVWEGDPAAVDAYKAGGFHPVVLSATDIIPSMQTGMIDTVAYPPAYALAIRLNDKAKYMSDLVWSLLSGALVVSKKTWDQVPEGLREPMLKVAHQIGDRTNEQSRKMEDEAMAKMKSQGLKVIHVTDEAEWRKMVEENYKSVRGKVVPADLFDEVYKLVQDYRANHKKS